MCDKIYNFSDGRDQLFKFQQLFSRVLLNKPSCLFNLIIFGARLLSILTEGYMLENFQKVYHDHRPRPPKVLPKVGHFIKNSML
jgi:hypothetical protein